MARQIAGVVRPVASRQDAAASVMTIGGASGNVTGAAALPRVARSAADPRIRQADASGA
jgi:hypothetical protein